MSHCTYLQHHASSANIAIFLMLFCYLVSWWNAAIILQNIYCIVYIKSSIQLNEFSCICSLVLTAHCSLLWPQLLLTHSLHASYSYHAALVLTHRSLPWPLSLITLLWYQLNPFIMTRLQWHIVWLDVSTVLQCLWLLIPLIHSSQELWSYMFLQQSVCKCAYAVWLCLNNWW